MLIAFFILTIILAIKEQKFMVEIVGFLNFRIIRGQNFHNCKPNVINERWLSFV